MKIDLSKDELAKCKRLLDVKENNICAAENYIEFLTYHSCDILSAKNEKDWFNQFNRIIQVEKQTLENSKMNLVTKLDPSNYLNDEYYQTIGQISASKNSWKMMTLKYEKFEGFVSDEIIVDNKYFSEHTPVSYFENEFKYFAVLENDEIWMSIIPHEINTMKQPIQNAFGNVLVLGLGLGYYVFNILNKKEVNFVTVIEKDKKIIDLFIEFLLDKFPNKNKLKIVCGDGIEFIKNTKEKFDYVFSDIWHNVGDGENLYLRIKKYEYLHPQTKFDYWIETSILAMLRRQTLTVFQEQLEGHGDEYYQISYNDNDKIINSIYFCLKNKQIKTFNDLHDILTDESLKVMATKLF